MPTQTANCPEIRYKKAPNTFFEFCGNNWLRKNIWPHWYTKGDKVIFVVDSELMIVLNIVMKY